MRIPMLEGKVRTHSKLERDAEDLHLHMLDLNKTPAMVLNHDAGPTPSSFTAWPFYFPDRAAPLCKAARDLTHCHARGRNSSELYISCLHHQPQAVVGVPVDMNTSTLAAWKTSLTPVASCFTNPDRLASMSLSPVYKHGRVVEVWPNPPAAGRTNLNPVRTMSQTTMDLEYREASDGESDCYEISNSGEIPLKDGSLKGKGKAKGSPKRPVSKFKDTTPQPNGLPLRPPMWSKHMSDLENPMRKEREAAFHSTFKFGTKRCIPTDPCKSCLDFIKTPMPKALYAECAGSLGALYIDEEHPPVLKNMSAADVARRKHSRHGPKSRSSEYRGVTFYKRTGRWEAHIWHDAAQVYLGASTTKEEAAWGYDKAALMLSGKHVDINFKPEDYQMEMTHFYKLSKDQLVLYLRRDSRGYGAQATYPGVKHYREKDHYTATYGEITLGTYPTEDDAAKSIYNEAVRNSFGELACLIVDTYHIRGMPSYAAERFAAVYPEYLKALQVRQARLALEAKLANEAKAKGPGSTSLTPKKKRSPRQAANRAISPPAEAASTTTTTPIALRPKKSLFEIPPPAHQINEETSYPRLRNCCNLGSHNSQSHLSQKRARRHAACGHMQHSPPHSKVGVNTTPAAREDSWPMNLYPRRPDAPAARSTTSQVANALSTTFGGKGAPPVARIEKVAVPQPAATPRYVKFKLFNVDITAPEPEMEPLPPAKTSRVSETEPLPPAKTRRVSALDEYYYIHSNMLRY